MASPVPPTLDELGPRPFSFYPPIVNIEHNEWTFQRGNWSEILVRNARTREEVWIPRSYLGEISKIDDPVMIVGLRRELEYKGGSLWPYTRRVVRMPGNVAPAASGEEAGALPETLRQALRLREGAEGGVGRMLLWVAAAGVLLVAGVAGYLYLHKTGGTVVYEAVLQAELGFTADSNYYDVVRKLGEPQRDHYRSETGERQYRLLVYPKRRLVVVLMGVDRGKELYIGSKDLDGKVVDAVELPGGQNTAPILRSLGKLD